MPRETDGRITESKTYRGRLLRGCCTDRDKIVKDINSDRYTIQTTILQELTVYNQTAQDLFLLELSLLT